MYCKAFPRQAAVARYRNDSKEKIAICKRKRENLSIGIHII